MMLTPSPGGTGNHLTEALSKRHPNGASVAWLQLFTIIGTCKWPDRHLGV